MPIDVDAGRGKEILLAHWEEILRTEPEDFIEDEELSKAIERIINSKTKSYRYAILTQVLAKVINPSVECCCLQKKRGGPGASSTLSSEGSQPAPFPVSILIRASTRSVLPVSLSPKMG